MSSELMDALHALAQEKKIDEAYLLESLESSLAKSYKSILGLENDARVTIDRETGKIYVFEMVPVGEPDEETGEYAEFAARDVTPNNVSRIAAANVKKHLTEILRSHERQSLYLEFIKRKGELISGQVLQTTSDFTILKIRDGVEAELPHFDTAKNPNEANYRPFNERYRHNNRIKAVIVDVRDPNDAETLTRGKNTRPLIVVSRTHPELIERLFEIEVPEIEEGIVEIVAIAREQGARSKVSVKSNEPSLDPVGACVGPKGSRVRMVVEELRNERVDVIAWSNNLATYVGNALSPAKVSSVTIDRETNTAHVVVSDDQLALAIGKEGQNARLAARLTGMRIDIKPASFVGGDLFASLISEEEESTEDLADERCAYVSENGIRCRNHARPGSRFCGIHEQSEAN